MNAVWVLFLLTTIITWTISYHNKIQWNRIYIQQIPLAVLSFSWIAVYIVCDSGTYMNYAVATLGYFALNAIIGLIIGYKSKEKVLIYAVLLPVVIWFFGFIMSIIFRQNWLLWIPYLVEIGIFYFCRVSEKKEQKKAKNQEEKIDILDEFMEDYEDPTESQIDEHLRAGQKSIK